MNIVITGTSNGLGLELARWYLARDHRVVGLSRSASRVEHHRYRHFTLDVGNRSQVVQAASDCGFDTVDLVINNAGLPGAGRRIIDVDPAEVQTLLDVNLFGSLHVVQAFLPRLRAAPAPRIVHVSSRFGSLSYNRRAENRGLRISYSYRIAKAAQNMLAVCLANELEEEGVAVEVLHPGAFQSACGRDDATDSPAAVAERIGTWLSSPPQELRLRETSGLVYDW